jgi:hypothetical protein
MQERVSERTCELLDGARDADLPDGLPARLMEMALAEAIQ